MRLHIKPDSLMRLAMSFTKMGLITPRSPSLLFQASAADAAVLSVVAEAVTTAAESFKAPAADAVDHDAVDAMEPVLQSGSANNTAKDEDNPNIFENPRINPLDEDHIYDMWSDSSWLVIATRAEDVAAKYKEEAEDASETTAARQLKSINHSRSSGITDCLLKVNKYMLLLEKYERAPARSMQVHDLRQLLLDTVVEVNRLKGLLHNPQNFAVAAAHAASRAAAAAISSTEAFANSRVRAVVDASRPVLTSDLHGLSATDRSEEVQTLGCGHVRDRRRRGAGGGRVHE